jgi:hypothetical protein
MTVPNVVKDEATVANASGFFGKLLATPARLRLAVAKRAYPEAHAAYEKQRQS